MKISVISFTRAGAEKNLELVDLLQEKSHQAASYSWHKYTGRRLIPFKSLSQLLDDLWDSQDIFIFLADLERTVRAVMPYMKKKGPAVIAVDEAGKFVIPYLKGKVRGTDEWCVWFAKLFEATPVITDTAARNEQFRLDGFARKNQLHIQDMFRIKTLAASLAAGEPVGIYSDYPIEGVIPEGIVWTGKEKPQNDEGVVQIPKVGISVTDDWEAPYFEKECRMFPRNLVLGVVCPEFISDSALEKIVGSCLADAHLSKERVSAVFSERDLADNAAMIKLADHLDAAYFTYSRAQLIGDAGEDLPMAQKCAKLGSGNGKQLTACRMKEGVHVCIYEKKVRLHF